MHLGDNKFSEAGARAIMRAASLPEQRTMNRWTWTRCRLCCAVYSTHSRERGRLPGACQPVPKIAAASGRASQLAQFLKGTAELRVS
eukprot:2923202-Prymnesium_polylepis.1